MNQSGDVNFSAQNGQPNSSGNGQVRSLVLAAHGSLAASDSNQPLFDLATAIQVASTEYDVVTPAFLNGQPEMTNVFEQLPPGEVTIVPVMTSEGYYLKKLPDKFTTHSDLADYRVFMSRVLGVHESLPQRIANHVLATMRAFAFEPAETTVVVIGHGTRRNATSGQSTYALTAALGSVLAQELTGSGSSLPQFKTAFLDQDPTAEVIAAEVDTPNVLIVPFLISRGPHTTEDIPQAFGLPSGADVEFPLVRRTDRQTIVCDLPIGMYPEMAEVCLELADEVKTSGSPVDWSVASAAGNDVATAAAEVTP